MQARRGIFAAALLTAGSLLATPAGAQSTPAATPAPSPAPVTNPFAFRGFFRAYDFTRQNASRGTGGAGQVNQQSIEFGLGLHADYHVGDTPITVGASYLLATPANGCGSPVTHLSPPCGRRKAPALNPDDSLPGFDISALYEAYVQYKDPRLSVKLGDQVFNSLWTSSSDTRIKPTTFQGVDISYALAPAWSVELADMIRFQGRVNSTFERNTLLTSFPAGTAGTPFNTFVPGGNSIPTAGLQYVRLGYAGTHGLASSLHLYRFDDIADLAWLEAKYTYLSQRTKPYLAFHGGYERETGAAVVGKIFVPTGSGSRPATAATRRSSSA